MSSGLLIRVEVRVGVKVAVRVMARLLLVEDLVALVDLVAEEVRAGAAVVAEQVLMSQ